MRIVTSILAWLLSLVFLGAAAMLAGIGAAMFPDYEQGGAYDVLQRTMRLWPFVAAAAALAAALIVNPLTSSRLGLAGKWGRASVGVLLMMAGVVGAMFVDGKDFDAALDQNEARIVEIENRHEARMKACGLTVRTNGNYDPHGLGREIGGGEASGRIGAVTYAAQASYDDAGRPTGYSAYRTCLVAPSGESVVLTDQMIRDAAGGPITVTVGGTRVTAPAADVQAAMQAARNAVADQSKVNALWVRCTYVIDTVDHAGKVIRPADAAADDGALATCLE